MSAAQVPPGTRGQAPIVVIGIGSEFRHDDGVGPELLARLRGQVPDGVELLESDGEPTRLLEAWSGRQLAVLVDAVAAGPDDAGRRHRILVGDGGLGSAMPSASSHGLGLRTAVELARLLDRLPGTLVVHGIEAHDFRQGCGLSPPVAAAMDDLVAAVLADVSRPRASPRPGTPGPPR